jgi:glucose/arabinose dehydrogenase
MKATIVIACIVLFVSHVYSAEPIPKVPEGVWVRPGYELSVVVKPENGPRFMALGPDGTLYFNYNSTPEIAAARDTNGDGYYETIIPFLKAEKIIFYVLWHDGWLWYTQSGAIYKARDKNGDGKADENKPVIPWGKLPSGSGHAWRSLLIHNDQIYTSIGDSSNISDETNSERQKIWSFAMDGRDKKLFCSGIRNTEKLVLRPGTDEIWGMDHGSDWFGRPLGDKRGKQPITDWNPPEEMNKYIEGGFYGHPFIVGNKLPRYEYMKRPDIIDLADKTIIPEWCGGAHWAANSMMFYTGTQFPPEHKGDAFIAYHGSWNRKEPAGYQVTRVLFENGKPYGELPYVKFLTEDGRKLGRPVDVYQMSDGSLLISEDGGETIRKRGLNTIYRLRYVGGK